MNTGHSTVLEQSIYRVCVIKVGASVFDTYVYQFVEEGRTKNPIHILCAYVESIKIDK